MKSVLTCCALAAVLVGVAASAANGRPERLPTLTADVGEWSIVPSVGALPAGRVRIEVRNVGGATHRLFLVRTARFGDRLPLHGSRAAIRPVGEAALVAPGQTASFVVSLARGSYVLLDNLPWHYWKGTSVAFSVR